MLTSKVLKQPMCNECNCTIEEDVFVSMSNYSWHVGCFYCSKCHATLDHRSKMLFLADGRPVCEQCSYSCSICNLRIDDTAIMTG